MIICSLKKKTKLTMFFFIALWYFYEQNFLNKQLSFSQRLAIKIS
jgi:hypothetical protein